MVFRLSNPFPDGEIAQNADTGETVGRKEEQKMGLTPARSKREANVD